MDTSKKLAAVLRDGTGLTIGGTGLAPYGIRHSGQGVKGRGFFGAVPQDGGGFSTEISTEFDHNGKTIEAPLLVPTLSPDEVQGLLRGAEPSEEVQRKAMAHALRRIEQGLSPFHQQGELRYPLP